MAVGKTSSVHHAVYMISVIREDGLAISSTFTKGRNDIQAGVSSPPIELGWTVKICSDAIWAAELARPAHKSLMRNRKNRNSILFNRDIGSCYNIQIWPSGRGNHLCYTWYQIWQVSTLGICKFPWIGMVGKREARWKMQWRRLNQDDGIGKSEIA